MVAKTMLAAVSFRQENSNLIKRVNKVKGQMCLMSARYFFYFYFYFPLRVCTYVRF